MLGGPLSGPAGHRRTAAETGSRPTGRAPPSVSTRSAPGGTPGVRTRGAPA